LLQSTSPSSTLDGAGRQQHDAFVMARKLRIQYPGAIYHVMNRGDRREAIFLGDEARRRDPRAHEFSVQSRAMDADRSGHGIVLGVLVALCGALIERSVKGGLIIVGALNLGGSVEMIPNPVAVAELAVEKGAATVLMPIAARRQLFELPDELATKISIEFYADPKDAFLKGLVE
jgi:ATP-dependent Lon protease